MKINVSLFTQTLQSLLHSGLSLQDSIYVCKDIFSRKTDKEFSKKIYSSVREGKLLSEALCMYKNDFSEFYISLVRIGEESGRLCEVFEKLSEYIKAKKEMKEKLIQSLAYPVLVLITAFIVIGVMSFFVFPRLGGIFEAFGENSALINAKINSITRTCRFSGIVLVFVFFALIFCALSYKKSLKAKAFFDLLLLRIPGVSKYVIFSQTQDFSFSMKLLSSAYYPLNKSLLLSAESASNICYKKAINRVYEKVTKGEEAGNSFLAEKVFPSYFITWIKLSERDGNILQAFSQIYDYFKTENERALSRMGVMAEPVFILITGIVIFTVIAQFVLPVFSLLGEL